MREALTISITAKADEPRVRLSVECVSAPLSGAALQRVFILFQSIEQEA